MGQDYPFLPCLNQTKDHEGLWVIGGAKEKEEPGLATKKREGDDALTT